MMVVYFAVRIIFIALMVVAIINLIKQIKDLLQRTITVRALRLSDALQNFAAAAGFQVSGMPGWFQRTWLLGGGVEQYEAGELFRLAKQLSRTVLFVQGNAIHFISTSATFPQQYRVAYEEFYRHNLDELRRRTLISLVRDTSDEHTRNVVTAAEIDRQGLVGLERVDIPYAPATRLGKLPAEKTIMAFVHALKVFGFKFSNVPMALKNLKDYPVVEREQFLPKLYIADNPQKVKDSTAKETLEHIAGNYTTYSVRRVYESVRMPMTAGPFQTLMAQGFPGVRSLRWRVADTVAEVEYEVADTGVPLNIVINYL
ncbi:MAG: hypothetical protein N2595_10915, partial [bacterium]|nr:hypothetical protein [bacterium]